MGSSSPKTKENDTNEKKENQNNLTSENNTNTKQNKKTSENLQSLNFQVEMFTEDENNSKQSSNNEENEDEDKEGSSIVEIRVFDYSSSDSESSIDYEVEDINDEKGKKIKKKEKKKEKEKDKQKDKKKEKEKSPQKKEKDKKEEEKKEEESKNEKEDEKKEEEKKEEKNEEKKEKEKTKKNKKDKKKKKKKSDDDDKIDKKKVMNYNKVINPPEEEEESSEFESEKIDSPHPSELIESNNKEKIYSEYLKNKNYFSPEEKKKSKEISKSSYESCTKNKYRKNILLHNDEVTSICSFDSKTKSIAYATSSLDRTIKFWTGKFKLIDTISNLLTPSLYLSEFDYTNLLSAEGVYIKMYDISSQVYECKFNFRDHIEEIYIIYNIITKSSMKFLSGGKDKIIRLWIPDSEVPIRYYEGHKNSIISIRNIANNKKLIASISEDKKCIIWEVNNSNMIYEFDNYFSPLSLIETKSGFCIGAYDNKIRFYNDEYSLKKCLKTKFYGNNLLLGDESNLFSADANGNINLIDLDKNELVIIFEGNNTEIVQMIKSYNWDPDPLDKNEKEKSKFYENKAENRTIITVNKDGYVYTYKNEIFKKMKIIPKEIYKKEEKKDKSSTDKTETEENKENDQRTPRKKVLKKRDKDDKSKTKTNKKVTFSNS